jgi:hypothetical protein
MNGKMMSTNRKNYHDRPIIFALIAFSIASMIVASIINNTNNVNNNLLAFAQKKHPGGSASAVSTTTTTTTLTTDPKKKSTSLPSSDNSGGGTTGNGIGVNGNPGNNGSPDGRGGKGGTGTTITTTIGNPPPPVKCKSGEVLKGGVCVPKPTPTTSPCPKGTHNVVTLGCVKNHLTSQEAFGLGCKMGFSDGPDQENYVGTGGIKHHSKAFTQGYNLAFGSGNTGACKRYLGNN